MLFAVDMMNLFVLAQQVCRSSIWSQSRISKIPIFSNSFSQQVTWNIQNNTMLSSMSFRFHLERALARSLAFFLPFRVLHIWHTSIVVRAHLFLTLQGFIIAIDEFKEKDRKKGVSNWSDNFVFLYVNLEIPLVCFEDNITRKYNCKYAKYSTRSQRVLCPKNCTLRCDVQL